MWPPRSTAAGGKSAPGNLLTLIQSGINLSDAGQWTAAAEIVLDSETLLPVIPRPPKIFCVGLNYLDHAAESPYKDTPTYPAVFPRYATSLVAHGQPMIRPTVSEQFDYEGELVVVIGKGGRHIGKQRSAFTRCGLLDLQ